MCFTFTSAPFMTVALQRLAAVEKTSIIRSNTLEKSSDSNKDHVVELFLSTSIHLYLPPLWSVSVPRFVYFSALENHVCRFYLWISHEMATAGVCPAEKIPIRPVTTSTIPQTALKATLRATHLQSAQFHYPVLPLQNSYGPSRTSFLHCIFKPVISNNLSKSEKYRGLENNINILFYEKQEGRPNAAGPLTISSAAGSNANVLNCLLHGVDLYCRSGFDTIVMTAAVTIQDTSPISFPYELQYASTNELPEILKDEPTHDFYNWDAQCMIAAGHQSNDYF